MSSTPSTPLARPTPPELTTEQCLAVWALVKNWFNEERPGRESRFKTMSVAALAKSLGVSNILYRYLSGGTYRGKPAGPPAEKHLGPLVYVLAADYGLELPAPYAEIFGPFA